MGSVDLSWTINKSLDYFLHLHGTEGTISVGWKESRIRKADGAWAIFGAGYDKVRSFVNQLENFAGCLLGKNKLLVTIDDGIASVAAVEAAYAALGVDPWVEIENSPETVYADSPLAGRAIATSA